MGKEDTSSLVEEYRSSASIHGISRIGASSLYSFRWIVWVCLVFAMAASLGTFAGLEVWHYSESPRLTKINAHFRERMEFPAVTICNLNQVKISILNCTDDKFLYDFFYRMSEVHSILKKIHIKGKIAIINGTKIWECVQEHSHQLSEFLVLCVWKNQMRNCSDVFKPVITKNGICYTFNGDKTNQIDVRNGQGSDHGLRVFVNIEQDKYFFASTIQAGIKVILHDPAEDPVPEWRGFLAGPGFSVSASVTRQRKTYLPSPYGNCIDTNLPGFKNPLTRMKRYTRLACDSECISAELYKVCKCRHFYFPGEEDLCDSEQLLNCIVPAIYNLSTEGSVYRRCANSCRRACEELTYDTSFSYASFGSDFIQNYLYSEGILPDKEYINHNFIDLRIYYDSLLDIEVNEVPETTVSQIIGTLGGNMGMFLGASVLSLVELIEFCILYCCKRRKSAATVTKSKSSEAEEIRDVDNSFDESYWKSKETQ